jgi:hypothetical protein
MKKIAIIATMLCGLSASAQKMAASMPPTIISYVTQNKDTLYLQDDAVGKLIKTLWDDNKFVADRKKPVIVFVHDLKAVYR